LHVWISFVTFALGIITVFNCALEAIRMMGAGAVSSSHNAMPGVTVQALRVTKKADPDVLHCTE